MNLEELFFIAQIVAGVAVVVSLVYLGNQIKQSRIQAENDAMDSITNGRANVLKLLAENNELSYIVPKGLASKTRLGPNEYFRFHSYLYILFVELEIGFIKWKRKDINNELWRAWEEAIHWWLKFPSVRKWWQTSVVGGFTDEFNAYVNGIIANTSEESSEAFEKELFFLEAAGNKPGQEKSQAPASIGAKSQAVKT